MEKGKCKRCGEDKYLWKDGICSSCHQEMDQERIKKEFDELGDEYDTWSTDYVICPHCGYAIPTDLGYEDFPEIYQEDDHKIDCPECEKTFILETRVSYSYETRKE